MAEVTYQGRTFEVADSETALLDYYRGEGAKVVVETPPAAQFPVFVQPGDVGPHTADEPAPFDPADHTVEEVNEHLDGAGEGEVARVLDLEREGKARAGVLEGPHAFTDDEAG